MHIIHNGKVYKSLADYDKEFKQEIIKREYIDTAYAVLCYCMASNEFHLHGRRVKVY